MSARISIILLCASLVYAAPGPLQVKVRTSKTAIWVGDRLEYTVGVEHPPEMEFVLDHLKKEDLSLQPFEVLDVRTSSRTMAGGRRLLEVKLLLTTLETGTQELTIPGFNLYYFAARQVGPREEAQAEVLAVPPFPVGLRSTLAGGSQAIRDFKEVESATAARWLVPASLGLFGLVLVGFYVARGAARRLRLSARREQAADRRARKKSLLEFLQEIRQTPVDSREDLDKFYRQASELLRNLAAEKLGDGTGLTPRETEAALLQAGDGPSRAATLGRLLEQCDHVRYAPDGYEQGRVLRDEFLQQIEAIAREEGPRR